jgi:GINS complex subunit 4
MDWDIEYERSKAGRTDPRAGPSFSGRDDDEVLLDNETRRGEGPVDNSNEGTRGGRVDLIPEEEPTGTPLEQLTRHWMNERHAPDILPAQENLLAHLLDHLRRQVSLSIPTLIIF